jgi:hypothetical protein
VISREEKRLATCGHDEQDVVNGREAHSHSRSVYNTRDAFGESKDKTCLTPNVMGTFPKGTGFMKPAVAVRCSERWVYNGERLNHMSCSLER